MNDINIPIFSGMTVSAMSFVASSRTTICDIMCVSNTDKERTYKTPQRNGRSLFAKLPGQSESPTKVKSKTLVDKYRYATNQEKRNASLKAERDEFFRKVEKDKLETMKKEASVIKIQAGIRGYLIRRPVSYVKKVHLPQSAIQFMHEIQDDLCAWADAIDLKPIVGLSLESKGKKSRRREKIEHAASLKIQSIIRMYLAVLRVERVYLAKKLNKRDKAAITLQKFFKWVMKKVADTIRETALRQAAVLRIQTCYRKYANNIKYRTLEALSSEMTRLNESAVKILKFISKVNYVKRKEKSALLRMEEGSGLNIYGMVGHKVSVDHND